MNVSNEKLEIKLLLLQYELMRHFKFTFSTFHAVRCSTWLYQFLEVNLSVTMTKVLWQKIIIWFYLNDVAKMYKLRCRFKLGYKLRCTFCHFICVVFDVYLLFRIFAYTTSTKLKNYTQEIPDTYFIMR